MFVDKKELEPGYSSYTQVPRWGGKPDGRWVWGETVRRVQRHGHETHATKYAAYKTFEWWTHYAEKEPGADAASPSESQPAKPKFG